MTTDAGSTQTRRIICIQDEAALLNILNVVVTRNFEYVEFLGAGTGELGLGLIANTRPDLIILDDILPGMGGIEVLQRLKGSSDQRHVPVLMMTARYEPDYPARLLELGANDYITVPFSPRELPDMISTLLGWPITLPHGG